MQDFLTGTVGPKWSRAQWDVGCLVLGLAGALRLRGGDAWLGAVPRVPAFSKCCGSRLRGRDEQRRVQANRFGDCSCLEAKPVGQLLWFSMI